LLTFYVRFGINAHMESMNEQYKAVKKLADMAKERTSDEVLLGFIDYLFQLAKALMEKCKNLEELQAREASDKYGSSSETLKGLSGKIEALEQKAEELKAKAESSGEAPAKDAGDAGNAEATGDAKDVKDAEAKQKRRAELLEMLKQLDREEAERQTRQNGSAEPAGQECETVERTVPEDQRVCPRCGAELRHLKWREAKRLVLKRMRLVRMLERIEILFCPNCARRFRSYRRSRARANAAAEGKAESASLQRASDSASIQPASAGGAVAAGDSGDAAGSDASVHEDGPASIQPASAGGAVAAGDSGDAAGSDASSSSEGLSDDGKPELEEDFCFFTMEAESMAVFPHCPVDAESLALLAVAKFEDYIPLARIERMFARGDGNLSRKTTYRWLIALGGYLAPFVAFMYGWLVTSRIVNADETPILVFREEGRPDKSVSYFWIFYGHGDGGPKVYYCLYAPTRSSSVAMDVLADLDNAFLQTDGYGGYNAVKRLEGVTGVSCLAHVRRRYHKIVKIVEEEKELSSEELDRACAACGVLKGIAEVYAKEGEIKERELPPGEIPKARDAEVRPIFDRLRREIEEAQKSTPPSGLLGRACGYALAQWEGILNYMKHPELTPDNNVVESCACRPVAMGRKNFLFFQSVNGAKAGAALYSLILTAKANGLNPEQYLLTLIKRFKHLKDGPRALWEELLPWNIKDLESLSND